MERLRAGERKTTLAFARLAGVYVVSTHWGANLKAGKHTTLAFARLAGVYVVSTHCGANLKAGSQLHRAGNSRLIAFWGLPIAKPQKAIGKPRREYAVRVQREGCQKLESQKPENAQNHKHCAAIAYGNGLQDCIDKNSRGIHKMDVLEFLCIDVA